MLFRSTALLDAGASAMTGWWEPSHQPAPEWESALYGAAGIAHDASLTRLLLEHGADPNVPDNSGGMPLHFAASSGSRRVVKLLLAHGAKINAKDAGGKTPLDVATVETADILRHYRVKTPKPLPPGSLPWSGRIPNN